MSWCLPAMLFTAAAPVARADCAHDAGSWAILLDVRATAAKGDLSRLQFTSVQVTKAEPLAPALEQRESPRQPSAPCFHCGKGRERAPAPRVNLPSVGELLPLSPFDCLSPARGDLVEAQPFNYHFDFRADVTPPPRAQ